VGDAHPTRAERRYVLVREVHTVRAPDVVRRPADLLEVLERPAAEDSLAILLLLDRLREVRVKAQAEAAGELGRLDHQPLRDREGRARGDGDLRPGAGSFLVQDRESLRVREHGVRVFHEVVRRQAAL
jgi:hypothetical protein